MKHGHTKGTKPTRTYKIWTGMKQRCHTKSTTSYKWYGARGISVCERWQEFSAFLEDMGEAPKGMTLDRIDNAGNYEPTNCRWVDIFAQANNRRQNYRLITHDGLTLGVRQWEKRLGLSGGALWHRIKNGWPIATALSAPRGARKP